MTNLTQQIQITYETEGIDQPAFIQGLIRLTESVGIPSAHFLTPPATVEKIFLVCVVCGEAFDNMIIAYRHSSDAGHDDHGFGLMPESDAL